jgi:hypothetical protein
MAARRKDRTQFQYFAADPDSALLPVALGRFFASLKPGGAEKWRNRHNR